MADHLSYHFPEGLRVFVIHYDTIQLQAIADLCYQCNYEVTTCTMASFAVHLLRETKGSFDVILLEAQMPDMDSYDFVQRVTQEIKIPIIMMGVDDHDSTRMNAIEKGACDYWLKPVNENHINNMWQHVVTIQQHDQICSRILEVKIGRKIREIGSDDQSVTKLETNAASVLEQNSDDNYQLSRKKNRVKWSRKLHEKFLRVVNQLGGIDNAKPKKIVNLMDFPYLTTAHVASHLQKLRVCPKRSSKKTKLKKEMPKCEEKISKQDQCYVPNERFEVVQPMPEQDHNVVLNSATECVNSFNAQQHLTPFDGFEAYLNFTNASNMNLDDPSSLYDAWYPSEFEYDAFGLF